MTVEVTFMSILLFVSSAVARKVVVLEDNDWDSITVTSPPVKITNSRFNTNSTKPKQPKMARECPEDDLKCFYDSQLTQNTGSRNPQDTIKKFMERFSSVTNVKINEDLKNASSKAYWNQINSEKHSHPFDDKKGWITLEPIPWSTSKVSKWKPNVSQVGLTGYGPPPSSQLWVTNGLQSGGDGHIPNGHWNLATNDLVTDSRPPEFPSYLPVVPPQGYQGPPSNNFNSGPYKPHQPPQQPSFPHSNYLYNSGPQYTQVPPPPANFPPQQSNYFVPPAKPVFVQNNYQSAPFNPFQGEPTKYPSTAGHPLSYPAEGNGEWVLLSTTKGYSVPQRYQDRKYIVQDTVMNGLSNTEPNIVTRNLRSKYEENIVAEDDSKPAQQEVNRKSGEHFDEPIWTVDGINILKSGKSIREQKSVWDEDNLERPSSSAYQHSQDQESQQPIMNFKRTARLTVLPSLTNNSVTAHDGLIEVDSSTQTVEEEQREEEERTKKLQEEEQIREEEERMKKLQQLATVTTGRQQSYRLVPINLQKGRSHESNRRKAAVLAAVGAGMIPATMAVLLPVALGRKRRSLPTETKNVDLNITLLNYKL